METALQRCKSLKSLLSKWLLPECKKSSYGFQRHFGYTKQRKPRLAQVEEQNIKHFSNKIQNPKFNPQFNCESKINMSSLHDRKTEKKKFFFDTKYKQRQNLYKLSKFI